MSRVNDPVSAGIILRSLPRAFDDLPIWAQLNITWKCNLDCAYCNEFDKVSKPVPLDDLINTTEFFVHAEDVREDGNGGYRAMKMALKRAKLEPEAIDYINAHGTSTPLGDEIELKAVERLLGNAASRVAMSSTKSATGHLLGAAGAVEAIFSLLAIRDGVAPATINLDNPSVETPMDLVPHHSKRREVQIVLSNSFGFGGTNASLVFRCVSE
jgi:3-oxoacyl-(acyl-carrier-protein) synthase